MSSGWPPRDQQTFRDSVRFVEKLDEQFVKQKMRGFKRKQRMPREEDLAGRKYGNASGPCSLEGGG